MLQWQLPVALADATVATAGSSGRCYSGNCWQQWQLLIAVQILQWQLLVVVADAVWQLLVAVPYSLVATAGSSGRCYSGNCW